MAGSLEHRVAERDRAEAALHESQRALSTLMSNLPGMAYRRRHGRQWTMEYVSEGGRQLTGYDPRALAQNAEAAYGDLIHPEDLDGVWAQVQAAVERKRPFEISYRILAAEQDWKWVVEKGQGVFSDDGRLLAVEGFVSDITERVLAQQTLERKVADRTRELAALYDVMAVVNASVGLETILENALDRVLAVMRVAVGAIYLLDESGEVLSLATCRGTPGEPVAPYRRLPIEGSLAGRVVTRGEPAVATEPGSCTTTDIAFPAAEEQVYVGVPMRARGHILGVLSLAGDTGRCFSDDEIALLGLIAEELAVAVENARLHQQARQVAVVRERERLARDLHDSVTQSLYSLTLLAEAARRLAGGAQIGRVEAHLERVVEISQQALREMRLLVYELRPLVLRREGLVGALQQRLDAVEKRAGIDARLMVEGEVDLPVRVEEAFYRIAQEALNNALKHARADTITVKVCAVEGSAMVEIADDGAGFDEALIDDTGGLGLANMRQRAEEVGASLLIGSTPGGGTSVRVSATLDGSSTGGPTREVA
jgi:PAS domain S-box-containing protein